MILWGWQIHMIFQQQKQALPLNQLPWQKLFSQIISALSAPTQAYLSAAGLEKVLNSSTRCLNRNVLPQVVGPTIMTFLYFPLPSISKSGKAVAKKIGYNLLLTKTSSAQLSHGLSQFSMQLTGNRFAYYIHMGCFLEMQNCSCFLHSQGSLNELIKAFQWLGKGIVCLVLLTVFLLSIGNCEERHLISSHTSMFDSFFVFVRWRVALRFFITLRCSFKHVGF